MDHLAPLPIGQRQSRCQLLHSLVLPRSPSHIYMHIAVEPGFLFTKLAQNHSGEGSICPAYQAVDSLFRRGEFLIDEVVANRRVLQVEPPAPAYRALGYGMNESPLTALQVVARTSRDQRGMNPPDQFHGLHRAGVN